MELVLRGLVYAVLIQGLAALSGWLPWLAHRVTERTFTSHFSALAIYALTVCVAAPTVVGLLLGTWLRDAEAAGALKWWHYALGGRDSRRAWDYAFSRQADGSWVRVVLTAPAGDGSTVILGKYGTRSWASQSPADPDLFLQEAWPADVHGQVSAEEIDRGSPGAIWISGDQIARIEMLS